MMLLDATRDIVRKAKTHFFWTRNSSGAVLPVGETRLMADFYVSADLTRTSERRLQAGKFLGF